MARNTKKPQMQKPPAENGDKPTKAIVTATSLADLAPRRGTVIVQRPDDQDDLAIPYKELSYKRYWEIGRMVEDPPPHNGEPTDFTKDEKGELRKVFSANWQEYQQALLDAESKRGLMRLAEFIDLQMEGETLEERGEYLQNSLPIDVLMALANAMKRLTSGSESRVEARAAAFRPGGNNSSNHLPANGVVDRKALVKSV